MEVRHFDGTIAGLGAKRDVIAHTCLNAGNLKTGSVVQCIIVACSNRTLRHQKSYKFIVSLLKMKSFSKNGSSAFRRKNLPNIQHCHICSDHFEPSCFEGILATAVDAAVLNLKQEAPKAAKREKKAAYINVEKLIIEVAVYHGGETLQFPFYGRLMEIKLE